MDTHSDHLTKVHISNALSQSRTRVAVLIVESLHLGMDLIDEQSPAVDEALIEHFETIIRTDPLSPRRRFRECLLAYSKEALKKARKRERRLYYGLTGPEPDAD